MIDTRTVVEALTIAVVVLSCLLGICAVLAWCWLRGRLDALAVQILLLGRRGYVDQEAFTRVDSTAIRQVLDEDSRP